MKKKKGEIGRTESTYFLEPLFLHLTIRKSPFDY